MHSLTSYDCHSHFFMQSYNMLRLPSKTQLHFQYQNFTNIAILNNVALNVTKSFPWLLKLGYHEKLSLPKENTPRRQKQTKLSIQLISVHMPRIHHLSQDISLNLRHTTVWYYTRSFDAKQTNNRIPRERPNTKQYRIFFNMILHKVKNNEQPHLSYMVFSDAGHSLQHYIRTYDINPYVTRPGIFPERIVLGKKSLTRSGIFPERLYFYDHENIYNVFFLVT